MDRSSWPLAGIAAVAVIALALVVIVRPSPAPAPAHLTVTGTGYVNVVPDTATVTVGVQKNAASAGAAEATADATMSKMMAAVKALGIPSADLQTEGYNVGPYYVPSTGRMNGYQVSDNLQITLTDNTSLAGRAVSAAIGAGANMVQGITWSVARPDTAMQEAYIKALTNARTTAAKLARSLGVTLVRVTAVSVENAQTPSPVFTDFQAANDRAAPLSPGTEQVSETLMVVFAFR